MFQVLDYVKERASLYELNKTVRMWERKVEIAEVKFDTSLSLITVLSRAHEEV